MRGRILQFPKIFNKKTFFLALAISFLATNNVFANPNLDEIDILRAQLNCIKDKSSPNYIKSKQKLEKTIAKYGINYSYQSRLEDAKRLIEEKKYNSAIYELDELISNNYETSICNELLADISILCNNPSRRAINLYKLALKYDQNNASAVFKLAKLYFREHKTNLAIENIKKAIDKSDDYYILSDIASYLEALNPQNKLDANNIYEALGNTYLKLGNKNGSYDAFKRAIASNSKDIYLKYYLTDLLYRNNQNDLAIEILNSIIVDMPNDLQIRATKAKVYAKMGNIDEANRIYLEILAKNPNSIQARYGIYKLYENKLDPKEILKKVNLNNNNYEPTIQDYKNFANMLEIMGEIEAAETFEIYQLNLIEPHSATIIPVKNKEISTPKTKEEVKKEIKKENKKPTTKKQTRKKQTKKQQVIDNSKNELLKQKQEEYKKQQEIKQQLENEKKAIELERKKAIAKNPKKYHELKAVADKYLAQEPKTAQNYIAAANTYKQLGETTSAIRILKNAMKVEPTNSDIYYHLGLAYFEQNDTTNAKTNLTKSINLDRENTKSQNLLAFVNQKIITQTVNKAYGLYQAKNYVSAFEILDKGIKDYPDNSQLYYYRALVFNDMNRNAAAVIDLQKAITCDPSNYMAFYQLGKLYEKIKNERSALVAYERFLSIEPDEKELVDEVQKKVINLGAKYY
ncbi:MAG: tetratricopeptide repeat protein [Candidatus Gastranaerophilales bacterium]|nr:tetratricopeptide repeat protein [Candidatus Gastranaerophilales bacterium]